MGKKATLFLLHVMLVGFTLVTGLLAVGGFAAPYISPYESELTPLLGLALPVSLIFCGAMAIYWTLQWRYWAWIPIVAVALNYRFLLAMFQLLPHQIEKEPSPPFRMVTYNIHNFGWGDYAMVAKQVGGYLKQNDIDIACFQEFIEIKSFTVDSVAKALGMEYYALPRSREGLDLVIFSRMPIVRSAVLTLDDSKYSTGVSMYADIVMRGDTVRIFTNHMQTTNVDVTKQFFQRQISARSAKGAVQALLLISNVMNMNFKLRATQVERIRRQVDASPYPAIVCGDHNDTPASYTYRTIKGDFVDGFEAVGKGYGYTFNRMKKILRIDYIFYDPQFEGQWYHSEQMPWSDHNPVMMELQLK